MNDSRNLAIKITARINDETERSFYRRMISNFVYASKEYLREGVKWDELELAVGEKEMLSRKAHVPAAIV